jgi:NodT family efflux transporter outer membrane factor (OMF) lipoprotein
MHTRVLIAALAAVLAGCTVGPDYKKPEIATPASWKSAPEATTPSPWPATAWWNGFQSPALTGYIEQAQRSNYDIAAAAARVAQADARAKIAGAALLPTLDAGADVSRSRLGSNNSSSTRGGRVTTAYSTSLAASYELDFWGKNRSALTSAQSLAQATRYDRETIAITTMANVGTTYFSVLEFRDRLTIALDNLENAERVLAIVEARVNNGAASALDLAQQRTVVANQRAAIPAFEQQLRQTENALAILLGETPDRLTIANGSLDDVTLPAIAPGLPSELLNRRPDVANAEAQLVAANADINTARAALFPSIQLTAQGGFASGALSSLFDGPGLFWTLVASVTQPIFEGGRLSGQVDLTEARYEELVQVYRSAVINAFRDTEDALVAIRQLADQQGLQEEAVRQAQAAFDLADTRYRGGLDTLLNVLDSQRTLFQARDQLAQVRSARLQATVALFRALGGGWAI